MRKKKTYSSYLYFPFNLFQRSQITFFSSPSVSANAMGRIGGITCPFIISRDTSLRLIGLVMFSVGIITALFTSLLPETTGTALGKAMHSRGGSSSCDENTQIVQYEGEIGVNTTLNNDTDRVHNDENKEASGTRRCITSFEIT